jgi:hypothetical protein
MTEDSGPRPKGRREPSRAALLGALARREREFAEAVRQQTATADVLKVISRSAFDLDAVLKTLTDSARSLSGAATAVVFLRDGDILQPRAESGVDPEFIEYLAAHPIRPGTENLAGRVAMTGEVVHIPDVLADPNFRRGRGLRRPDGRKAHRWAREFSVEAAPERRDRDNDRDGVSYARSCGRGGPQG